MHTQRLPLVVPLSGRWTSRLRTAVAEWVETRRQRRADLLAERQICRMSAAALDDIAAPEGWRAAAANCRARDEMERSLLRVGFAPGAPW